MSLKNDILLVYLPSPAPPDFLAAVKSRFPDLQVRWHQTPVQNGVLLRPDEYVPDSEWQDVTLVCIYHVPKPELVKNVRFFQTASAGTDWWRGHERYENKDVVFSNASGCQPPQIAEWVIGSYLSHQHHFQVYADQQKQELWYPRLDLGVQVSTGRRMGILGYGSIGRQCARLGQALGMEVYAYTLSEKQTPESRRNDTYCVAGTGDPEGLIPTKWFFGSSKDDINNFLAQDLDLLVISLPLSSLTRDLLSTEQFQILSRNRNKTFLSNIARGAIVDQVALVHALENDLIRGAAIDVADPEPLPTGHILWKAPNLFITPHIAWQSSQYWNNLSGLLLENLGRLSRGESVINQDKRSN